MDDINKLQKFYPQRFTEMCLMHLTIIMDLKNVQLENLLHLNTDCKPKKKFFLRKFKEMPVSDNSPLTPETIGQIHAIIEYLRQNDNLIQEGIFRKSGSVSRQQELKAILNAGKNLDFKNLGQYTVHDFTGIVKQFLSELPEPLLTEAHYMAYCQIAEMTKDDFPVNQKDGIERQLKAIKLLLLILPPNNYSLLKVLLSFLFEVKEAQETNKMTSENLATIFVPHLLCPKKMSADKFMCNSGDMIKIVVLLINNATLVFEPPLELVQDVKLCLKEVETKKNSQSTYEVTEPIKTTVQFCQHTDGCDDETKTALAELKQYVQELPNSGKKRKLLKKFEKEETDDNQEIEEKRLKSKSVGEMFKKHFTK